jgi:hypothetical protein
MSSYSAETILYLKTVYIVLTIIWIVVVIYWQLWLTAGASILLIPLILFSIAYFNLNKLTEDVEGYMGQANYLSMGLVIALPLLIWLNNGSYSGDKRRYSSVIILALVLSLVTLVDVWVPSNLLTVYKHIKSSFQVMSITLFIYALVHHYLSGSKTKLL